jgi:hypothetical protein
VAEMDGRRNGVGSPFFVTLISRPASCPQRQFQSKELRRSPLPVGVAISSALGLLRGSNSSFRALPLNSVPDTPKSSTNDRRRSWGLNRPLTSPGALLVPFLALSSPFLFPLPPRRPQSRPPRFADAPCKHRHPDAQLCGHLPILLPRLKYGLHFWVLPPILVSTRRP